MALRTVVTEEDEILRKKSKEVVEINDRILTLLDDMWETMLEYDGAGIAAPQVGVLRRVVVIDFKKPEDEESKRLELINPRIVRVEGERLDDEACLSVPGVVGKVRRPERVVVKALDRNGKEIEVEGEGFLAKALSHELDHLDGILFVDIAEEFLDDEEDKE